MKKIRILFIILFTTLTSFANESTLYDFKWLDEGEKVYVIQNKEHVKAGGLGIDFSIIDSNSSPYQDTTGMLFALTYYFSENWSIDFTYKKYNNSKCSQTVTFRCQILSVSVCCSSIACAPANKSRKFAGPISNMITRPTALQRE